MLMSRTVGMAPEKLLLLFGMLRENSGMVNRLLKLNDFNTGYRYRYLKKYISGHEIVGLDKLPTEGPALIIYYHGALPVDVYYLVAKVLLLKNRQIRAVGDRFLFKIPGLCYFVLVLSVVSRIGI